jgi:hypothetical protein
MLLNTLSQSRDKLSLYASGRAGIEELRPHLRGDVFFALIREDRSLILISFVPEDISGVRRGELALSLLLDWEQHLALLCSSCFGPLKGCWITLQGAPYMTYLDIHVAQNP